MNNKIMVRGLIIFFLLSAPVYAKQKQEPEKQLSIDDIVTKLKKQLELTDEQVDEIKPIVEDYLAKEKQLKLDEKKELSRVLTGDQMYAWNSLENEPSRKKKHASF